MTLDPIVAEVCRVREAYAEQFDFEVEALGEDLKNREAKSKRRLVSLPPAHRQAIAPAPREACRAPTVA
jgi:hypothetical protein